MINEALNNLLNSQKITAVEAREVFDEIFSGLSNDIQTASFLTALSANQIDEDIICAAIDSSIQAIKKPYSVASCDNLIENIVLSDNLETIDIVLLQDLICSSAELAVSRYFFESDVSRSRTFDIFNLMGVKLEKQVDYFSDDFEKLNFNYFYLHSSNPYFKYTKNINLALPIENVLNVTSKMLNPLNAQNLFLGVNKKELVDKYAGISLKLERKNAIVVSGDNGISYISPCGESYVAEAWKNKIFTYALAPQLLGFNEYDFGEIYCENNDENAKDILDIIYNKNKGAKYVVSVLNSGLSLYISKKADSIYDGVKLAQKLIVDGVVAQKFEQIKRYYA